VKKISERTAPPARQGFARAAGALVCMALGAGGVFPRGAAAVGDRLAGLLRSDDDHPAALRDEVKALGGSACTTLSGYAADVDERVRERAVLAMDGAGCAHAEDYAPFFHDRSAWVVRAVIVATARQRLVEAAPFYLRHLGDRRRLVSDDDSQTIEDAAQRALHRLTAQPIPYDPRAPLSERDLSAHAWRDFFTAHGRDGTSAWLASGSTAIQAGLDGDPLARRAALDTLPLVGEPAGDLLTAALRRAAGDVEVALVCTPDSPPRVGEEIPCTWRVHNLAAHRVALALAPPRATIVTADAASASAPAAPARATGPAAAGKTAHDAKPKAGSKGSGAHGSPDGHHAAPAGGPAATAPAAEVKTPAPAPIEPEALAGTIVDLAPGETMQRPIFIGPVESAGHYEVRVACDDLGWRFRPSAFPPGLPPLQAAIPMRFEQ
jgi:hypothetical protein